MSLSRFLRRFPAFGCLAVLGMGAACQRHEVVAESLVLDRDPVTLAFRTPYVRTDPREKPVLSSRRGPFASRTSIPSASRWSSFTRQAFATHSVVAEDLA